MIHNPNFAGRRNANIILKSFQQDTQILPSLDELRKGNSEEGDIEKGGEGSKGGRVIGHTKSGKPIYQSKVFSGGGYTMEESGDHGYSDGEYQGDPKSMKVHKMLKEHLGKNYHKRFHSFDEQDLGDDLVKIHQRLNKEGKHIATEHDSDEQEHKIVEHQGKKYVLHDHPYAGKGISFEPEKNNK